MTEDEIAASPATAAARIAELERDNARMRAWIEESQSFVYVFRFRQWFKIGISDTPDTRIKGLNASLSPRKGLQIINEEVEEVLRFKLLTRKKALLLERELHDKFSRWRQEGEWFRLSPDKFAAVEETGAKFGGVLQRSEDYDRLTADLPNYRQIGFGLPEEDRFVVLPVEPEPVYVQRSETRAEIRYSRYGYPIGDC
jgi:hypothetical protein